MRVSFLLLCLFGICRSQEAVTKADTPKISIDATEQPDATKDSDAAATSSTTAPASSPTSSHLPGDEELILSEEVPVTGPESVNEIPVSDVIEDASEESSSPSSASSNEADERTANLDSSPSAFSNKTTASATDRSSESSSSSPNEEPVQAGPFIDLLGPHLLSLEMIDPTHAQLALRYTNDALADKKVVGLYFSADWCGPCRKFTPELVNFYNKMNERRGNSFEIIWISRCRDVNSFGQYFTHMNWLALPPEEAMGERGRILGDKYKVKGIPSLVLLDEVGSVITRDARNKIPTDKAGIGFPWRNPIANIYVTLFPRSVRLMVKSQVGMIREQMFQRVKRILGLHHRRQNLQL